MGKGKGSISHFITKVNRGTIILEIKTNLKSKAISALNIAKSKLPMPTTIISTL